MGEELSDKIQLDFFVEPKDKTNPHNKPLSPGLVMIGESIYVDTKPRFLEQPLKWIHYTFTIELPDFVNFYQR